MGVFGRGTPSGPEPATPGSRHPGRGGPRAGTRLARVAAAAGVALSLVLTMANGESFARSEAPKGDHVESAADAVDATLRRTSDGVYVPQAT